MPLLQERCNVVVLGCHVDLSCWTCSNTLERFVDKIGYVHVKTVRVSKP